MSGMRPWARARGWGRQGKGSYGEVEGVDAESGLEGRTG